MVTRTDINDGSCYMCINSRAVRIYVSEGKIVVDEVIPSPVSGAVTCKLQLNQLSEE